VLLFELLKERQSQYSHEVLGVVMIKCALYFPKREMSTPCWFRLGKWRLGSSRPNSFFCAICETPAP